MRLIIEAKKVHPPSNSSRRDGGEVHALSVSQPPALARRREQSSLWNGVSRHHKGESSAVRTPQVITQQVIWYADARAVVVSMVTCAQSDGGL